MCIAGLVPLNDDKNRISPENLEDTDSNSWWRNWVLGLMPCFEKRMVEQSDAVLAKLGLAVSAAEELALLRDFLQRGWRTSLVNQAYRDGKACCTIESLILMAVGYDLEAELRWFSHLARQVGRMKGTVHDRAERNEHAS